MRKHGWQLPYHPLQVVAIAVFLALGMSFYVFFLPFVGRKPLEYVIMALYTPLVTCVFCVYIWCAATDPSDSGVFKSKKYHNIDNGEQDHPKISNQGNGLIFSCKKGFTEKNGDKLEPEGNGAEVVEMKLFDMLEREKSSYSDIPLSVGMLGWYPFSSVCIEQCSPEEPCDLRLCEDGMFYCSLCEVEVLKYSKHCRVCDKCVYGFDHHCRWLNNCIGRRNYVKFFILMVSALLLLILQWSVGVFVLILTFTERKRISSEIFSMLGSGFSLVPFIVVVATCTLLAMIAALELAQLFFFHILLIKKGISTYDYIIALREKEQQGVDGHQSPQMSSVSSITGLSSASSFSAFHRGAWCTPPRLFLEDELDVVPIEPALSVISMAKRSIPQDLENKKSSRTVKISPWKLARLNTEEVSKAAVDAKKKSGILQPVQKHEHKMPLSQERQSHSISRMVPTDSRIRTNTRVRIPVEFPLEPLTQLSSDSICSSPSLKTLQLEARSAFLTTSGALSSIESYPESGLDSPDLCPFRVSSSGIEDAMSLKSFAFGVNYAVEKDFLLSRSISDGYEASGVEDSDRVPTMIVQRSSNWSNLLHSEGHMLKGSTSAGL